MRSSPSKLLPKAFPPVPGFPSAALLISQGMAYEVAAFYQFTTLPEFRELREPLRALCAGLELKGTVLLAHEGVNGTLADRAEALAELIAELRGCELFGGR